MFARSGAPTARRVGPFQRVTGNAEYLVRSRHRPQSEAASLCRAGRLEQAAPTGGDAAPRAAA